MREKTSLISMGVSLFIHLLILFLVFFSFHWTTPVKELPNYTVPAYMVQEPAALASHPLPMPVAKPISPLGIEKPAETRVQTYHKTQPMTQKTEPIHLIGNKKKVPTPLIKLLAKALTASLIMPKMAVDFSLRGITTIRFLLHPDGQITEIQLLKSSSTSVLDSAALDAVRAISPLPGVHPFLTEPKYIVFGFIFGRPPS